MIDDEINELEDIKDGLRGALASKDIIVSEDAPLEEYITAIEWINRDVDTELSTESINPVQNKVITSAFNNLATVASSGSYNDLSDKPSIPDFQVNADWNATSGKAQILNKPTIPAAVTVDSALSTTSTNPVQNKVVKEALDLKLGRDATTIEVKCVVETHISGNSWYRVWSDGWCEQGAISWNPTFLKPFKDTNYTVVAVGTVYQYAVRVSGRTTTGCTFEQWQTANGATSTTAVLWYACGFIS